MNNESRALVQAITGPIILITVGSLFALDKSFGYPFHQTWPVLIIVIGLLKLFGGKRRGYGYPDAAKPGRPTNPTGQTYNTAPPFGPNQPRPAQPAYGQPNPDPYGYDPNGYNPSAPPPPPRPGVRQ